MVKLRSEREIEEERERNNRKRFVTCPRCNGHKIVSKAFSKYGKDCPRCSGYGQILVDG